MKIAIIILLLVILYCLGSALLFMLGSRQQPEKMAKALTWRISLSMLLFVFLIAAYYVGWIQPHDPHLFKENKKAVVSDTLVDKRSP